MKIIVTETQMQSIMDARDFLGSGVDHIVYKSNFSDDYYIKMGLKKGDIVGKIGEYGIVKDYAEDFKKFPDIFPIVYKYGKRTGNQPKNGYMYIEKLDTEKFFEDWQKLYDIVGSYNFMKLVTAGKVTQSAIKKVKATKDNDIYNFMIELGSVISKLYNVRDKLQSNRFDFVDTHGGNFGYDKNGKIKSLDF
jgi:hypothetical protein